jgi:hypothetical protein
MTSTEPAPTIPRRGSGPRPEFLGNAHLDNLLSMVMTLCQELWVVDERVGNLEQQVAELRGVSVADVTEAPESTPETRAARRAELDEFIRRVLRSTIQSMQSPSDTSAYEAIVKKVGELA